MNEKAIVSTEDSDFQTPVRRRELAPFYAFRQEMDRLFNDFFDQENWFSLGRDRGFNPNVNVIEKEHEFEITAELPGIEEKDIDLTLERDMLTIKGEKKVESEEESGNFYRSERSYGQFCRTVQLPVDIVEQDNVTAIYRNGVLTVTLPKRKEIQQTSKKIKVEQA